MYFGKAYAWMVEQMKKRIGVPSTGIDLPIWAWHTWDWKHTKPDLRYASFQYKTDHYLFELEVPDCCVVLSDEEAWHYVLNNSYFNPAVSDQEWDILEEKYDSLPSEQQAPIKHDSWQRIFDVSPVDNSPWSWTGKYVQATFWEIKSEYLVSSQFVKGRSNMG